MPGVDLDQLFEFVKRCGNDFTDEFEPEKGVSRPTNLKEQRTYLGQYLLSKVGRFFQRLGTSSHLF